MAEVGVLNLTIQDNSEQAAAGLDKLASALERVKNAVSGGMRLSGVAKHIEKIGNAINSSISESTLTKINQLAETLQKLKSVGGSLGSLGKVSKMTSGFSEASGKVEELKEKIDNLQKTEEVKIPIKTIVDPNMSNIFENEYGNPIGNTKESVEDAKKYAPLPARTFEDYYNGERWKRDKVTGENIKYQQNDLMSNWLHGQGTETEQLYAIQQVAQACGMSIDEVREKLAQLNGTTQDTGSQMDEIRDKTENASFSLQSLKERLGELKQASGQGIFSKLLTQFERLLRFRVLRNLVKRITSGFSEGIENVYNYSKAISGTLAPSMDSAVSMFAQMKNSLGAALAPAIQAIIPILNSAVNWFISLINVANQFFALLGGQSVWTKALPQTTNSFDKQKKAAAGAGAAIKDLLADWDELNIIQSNTTGGGGSAKVAEDYLKMFEQVSEFDNRIKKIVDFIKRNIDDIWDIAKKIGIALLGWKVSTAFTGLLSQLGSLVAAGAVIGITWQVTTLFDREYMKTGEAGWLVADAITNLVGATLAGGIISTVLGGAAG